MSNVWEESGKAVIAVEEAPPERETKRRERTKSQNKPKREPNYHVIIWNDEEHSYEYVIELLMTLFSHPFEKAYQITHEVDSAGKGIAWTCHKELAELKRDQILAYGADPSMPKISKGPIRATIEPAPE
jgi:ATP-dependent Clp protease adaptor protein ClpS